MPPGDPSLESDWGQGADGGPGRHQEYSTQKLSHSLSSDIPNYSPILKVPSTRCLLEIITFQANETTNLTFVLLVRS